MKKYDIDENYFEKIDSPEKAYLLGLIYADGCNYTPTNTVTLCLQEQDKHILEDIKELLHYNAPLKKIKPKKESHQTSFVLTIHSKKISTDLTALGVMQNKTFKITFPYIDKDLFSHFIRGYFDGDGCIITGKRMERVSFVGTDSFINTIQDIFLEKLNLSKTVTYKRNKEKNISTCYYKGRYSCKKIRDYLYNESTIHFKRKYLKFFSLL